MNGSLSHLQYLSLYAWLVGNTLLVSVCSHMYQWLTLSSLQRSAVAIQEVRYMVAQWETASTSTMWSALFVIGVMRWRGPHVLSVRQTASGATRLQRVKVGKKVKCITPNLIYPKPYIPFQLLSPYRNNYVLPPFHFTSILPLTLFNLNISAIITPKHIFTSTEKMPFFFFF